MSNLQHKDSKFAMEVKNSFAYNTIYLALWIGILSQTISAIPGILPEKFVNSSYAIPAITNIPLSISGIFSYNQLRGIERKKAMKFIIIGLLLANLVSPFIAGMVKVVDTNIECIKGSSLPKEVCG